MLPRTANSSRLIVVVFMTLAAAFALAQDVLLRPEPPFQGRVGRTVQDSTLDFPQEVKAPIEGVSMVYTFNDGYRGSKCA